MKKLVAILLLSFTLPLCAMEATMEYHSDGSGSGGEGEESFRPVIGFGTPLSPVSTAPNESPEVLRMVHDLKDRQLRPLFEDEEVEPTDPVLAVEGAAPVSPPGESLGGGGGASSRVPAGNASPISKWYSPKSPVLRIVAPTSLVAIIMGGYLTRRHVKKQRALGKPTVFDRMGQWVQQRYRGLVRSPKKPAGEDGRREKTTSETSA